MLDKYFLYSQRLQYMRSEADIFEKLLKYSDYDKISETITKKIGHFQDGSVITFADTGATVVIKLENKNEMELDFFNANSELYKTFYIPTNIET